MSEKARSMEARGFVETSNDDRWIMIQKKTFQNWINDVLKESGHRVKDLQYDFCDGSRLIALLEILTQESGCKWKNTLGTYNKKKSTSRIHNMETVEFALGILKFERIDLTNLGASDIVDGSLKLILGLVWKLILKYQIEAGKTQSKALRARLLDFLNTILPGINLRNFSSDWNSGSAICGLCNFCDHSLFPDYKSMTAGNKLANCQQAISVAEARFRVPQVLTPEDMSSPDLDDQSGMTYVSYFMKDDGPATLALLKWVNSKIPDMNIRNFGADWKSGVALCALNNAIAPGTCPDYQSLDPRNARENCQRGIDLGQKLGVSPVMTADQLSADEPDHLAVMTHVAKYLHAKPPPPQQRKLVDEEQLVKPVVSPQLHASPAAQSPVEVVGAPAGFGFDDTDTDSAAQPADLTTLQMEPNEFQKLPDGSPAVFQNKQVTYYVDLPVGVSLKDLTVVVDCPNRQRQPVLSVTQRGPSTAQVSFTPLDPGEHLLHCQLKGRAVNGSPARLDVFPDPDNVSINAQEIEAVLVSGRAEFIVNTVSDVGDLVKARVVGPGGKVVNCQSVKDVPGVQRFFFSPKQIGLHQITVTYNNKNVRGSPFLCDVYDPSKVSISGFKDCTVNETINFTVDASSAGAGEPEVRILHNHSPLKVDLKRVGGKDSGQFRGTVKPTGAGAHQAYVYFYNDLVNGRPVEFTVTPAGAQVKCYGPGLQKGVEDVETNFTIDASKSFRKIEHIEVKAEGVNSLAKCAVSPKGDGTYSVTYKPVEVGTYKIHVYLDGQPLESGPYSVQVIDPKKVKCVKAYESFMDKDGHVMLHPNKKFSLPFDVSNAGPGQLKAKVCGPSGHVVPCQVEGNDPVKTISFVPKTKGKYEISVTLDDCPVPRSPLTGLARDSFAPDVGHVTCQGPGLKEARVREETSFTIDTSQALTDGEIKVSISGLHGDIEVHLVKERENAYRATYTPYMQGMYLVHVAFAERQVKGSPFKVVVYPSINSQAVQAFGSGLKEGIIGQPIKFGVDARSAGPEAMNKGILSCNCKGPKKPADVEVTDNHDGTFSMNIRPKEPGKHVLEIKYDEEHIQGSPFIVRISGPPDASRVRVFGPGVEHGVLVGFQGTFICDTKGAGAGQLKVRIHGPKGAFKVEMQRDSNKDRSIIVTYNPTEPGDYKIQVWWSDVEIPQSPFEVKVFGSQRELEDFLLQYPSQRNRHRVTSVYEPSVNGGGSEEHAWKADV